MQTVNAKQPVSLSTTPQWHVNCIIIVYGCETWSYPFWGSIFQLFSL